MIRGMRGVAIAIGVISLSTGLVACGSSDPVASQSAGALTLPGEAGHVHGIVQARSGGLLVGTHGGLFAQTPGGSLGRVGDPADYMGLAAMPSGALLSSGHPAPGSGEPDPLGLRLSRDEGRSWTTITQVPRDDFHVIGAGGGRIYAVGSDGAVYAGSAPTTLTKVANAPEGLIDLAIEPGRGSSLLASTQSGLQRSTNGGRTWTPAGEAVGLLSWVRGDLVFLVDADGVVSASDDGGASWSRRGELGAPPAALLATSPTYLVAADHDGRITTSRDGGRTWSQ